MPNSLPKESARKPHLGATGLAVAATMEETHQSVEKEVEMIRRAVGVLVGVVAVFGVIAALAGFFWIYAAVIGVLALALVVMGTWYMKGGHFEKVRTQKLAAWPFQDNQGKILMIGSSSFEYWKAPEQDLAPLDVINLGIGGTAISHWTTYLDSTVVPYAPKGVMVYAGLNDFNTRANPEAVFARMKELLDGLEQKLAGVTVLCLGLCPTVARASNWSDIQKFNAMVAELCESKPGLHFLDSTAEILDAGGQLQKEIYRFDGIHFNDRGYACWVKSVNPAAQAVFSR